MLKLLNYIKGEWRDSRDIVTEFGGNVGADLIIEATAKGYIARVQNGVHAFYRLTESGKDFIILNSKN